MTLGAAREKASQKSCTVFLVDDDPDDLNLARRVLRSSPYVDKVICLSSGEELIRTLQMHKVFEESDFKNQENNLIILDIHMPGLNGIELLRMLRTNPYTEDTPIMILTGDSATNNALDSYNMHSNGFIAKPLREENLPHIHRIIDR